MGFVRSNAVSRARSTSTVLNERPQPTRESGAEVGFRPRCEWHPLILLAYTLSLLEERIFRFLFFF